MTPCGLAPDAVIQAADAAAWYESQRAGLAAAFPAEIDRALSMLARRPASCPRLVDVAPDLEIRRLLLPRFPQRRRGALDAVRKDLPDGVLTGEVERRLTVIETQVARVIEIIARLLDLTRRPVEEPRPVDLNRLVRETGELVRPGVSAAGLTLEVVTAPDLPPVSGSVDQLQQVILNLVTNALDATAPGGRVTVGTRALAAHGEVELTVSDSGHGIAAADQPRVFDPFFSTKPTGQGTGLGLFIAAQIVREHQGRIALASEPGRGATFQVHLPVATTAP